MELKRLRAFVAAAEAPSFRQAAHRLGVQISSLSRNVSALEDELGVTLFERTARGAQRTDVGRGFLIDARRILADVDRARDATQRMASGKSGRLRLAVCEDATTPIFARLLTTFRTRCADVALELFELPSAMQAAALLRGEIDAGLLLPPVSEIGIEMDELWRDPWAVAFCSGHQLGDLDAIKIGDLARFDIITAHPVFGPGCHDQAQVLFTAAR